MKIYLQRENVRVYRGIALVCVYTMHVYGTQRISMGPQQLYEYTHICECIAPLRVHPNLYVSTPPIHVYQLHVSIHLHMSTLHPHVYTICTCIFEHGRIESNTSVRKFYLSINDFMRTHSDFENLCYGRRLANFPPSEDPQSLDLLHKIM